MAFLPGRTQKQPPRLRRVESTYNFTSTVYLLLDDHLAGWFNKEIIAEWELYEALEIQYG